MTLPARTSPGIVVVGQGPNRAAWEHGLAAAERLNPARTIEQREAFSKNYCSRVAITGRVGEKLAALAGLHRLDFYRKFGRRNLNARWNGKYGKGDVFDRVEAEVAAARLIDEPFERYVLLGANVAKAFGMGKNEWFDVVDDLPNVKHFLIFPHPSGINTFWNERGNAERAQQALRDFLFP